MKKQFLSVLLAVCLLAGCLPLSAGAAAFGQRGEKAAWRLSADTGEPAIEGAFTDAAFLAAVRRIVGKTNGEHIYPSDVKGVTKLEVFCLDIASLNGIEYFTSLQELYCYDNCLVTLDLSRNPELKVLHCYVNDFVELDLSHNPKLEVLDCSYSYVRSINVSSCPELRQLDCNYTDLQDLDVTKNSKLTSLVCFGTSLRTLDVSKNLLLETLDTWDAYLTNLDVSNNTKLKYLDCSLNWLADLDLTKNRELSHLECQNNGLTSLDLTNNPALEYLWCYGNSMDPETPENSIRGLEPLLPKLGQPSSKVDDLRTRFAYFPQNAAEDEHDWKNNGVTLEPTCTEKGAEIYICLSCPIVRIEEIPALGHTPGKWETAAPATAEQEGLRVRRCAVCRAELEREAIPKLASGPAGFPFTDVPDGAYYRAAVEWAVENGIASGTSETEFSPNALCTRGQVVTFLWRAAGRPEPSNAGTGFVDVRPGAYYEKAVQWAAENHIASGTGGGKFSPEAVCTRAEAVAFLYRAKGSPAVSDGNSFSDVKAGAYYQNAVGWAAENGIASGTGNGKFSPGQSCTRGQSILFLCRAYR